MRKSKAETAETRKKVVAIAADALRRDGIQATGVADVMAEAGLTHGGFYRHFASKDQLVAEACAAGMADLAKVINESAEAAAAQGESKASFRSLVENYLSTEHRDNPSGGCFLVGLGSELARADEQTRTAATEGFAELVETIEKRIKRRKPDAARSDAVFALSAMIGAVTMARVINDAALSDAVLEDVKRHLYEL
jgi:TetR/AcrR family transcriptional regulator, transcriptional repressor for nem operon